MISDDNVYDVIFINGTEIYSKAVCSYFYKKSGGRASVCLLEDGVGTYERILLKEKNLRIAVTKFILGYDVLEKCHEVYAYRPDLISSDYELKKRKIPSLTKEDSEALLHSFLEEDPERIDETIIFLEGAFPEREVENMQDGVLCFLADLNLSIALKSHPLYLGKSLPGIHELDSGMPFELYGMNQPMDEKVLISVCSTAAFTPKLMLDQEPAIVFLYKMLPGLSGLVSLFERMLAKFEKIYDRSKIFKPETKDELKKILADL